MSDDPVFRPSRDAGRWDGVEVRPYKDEGDAPFKDITRQALFVDGRLGCELRYFEMASGGHSTLERHEHVHAVMIFRGRGEALVGGTVRQVDTHDLVTIPPMTWHQFRANRGEPLGFLCMVNAERDRPQLPSETELDTLRQTPEVAAFLDGSTPRPKTPTRRRR